MTRPTRSTRHTGFTAWQRAVIVILIVVGTSLIWWNTGAWGSTIIGKLIIAQPDLEQGLIGHWSMDIGDIDLSQVTAEMRDRSQYANHGDWESHASTTMPGAVGQSAYFDGVDDFVDVADSGSEWDFSTFTAAAWVRPDSISGNKELMGDGNKWRMLIASGTWQVWMRDGSSTARTLNGDAAVVGEWVHVAQVYDGTDMILYINGVESARKPNITGMDTGANNQAIGRGWSGSPNLFEGAMDDVRIYDRALEESEIKELHELASVSKVSISLPTQPTLESGMVGHWTMDGSDMDLSQSTAEVRDRSGSGNHANWENHSSAVLAGRIGQAIEFDGVNDSVTIGNPASVQVNTGTLSAWIKTSSPGSGYRGIVIKSGAYGMYLYNSVFGMYDNGSSSFKSSGVDLADGTWHHVAASFQSGTTNGTTLYIDGAPVGTITITNSHQSGTARIGMGQGGTTQVFTGLIDDARIYNRVLSSQEISRLYQLGGAARITTTTESPATLSDSLALHLTFDGNQIDFGIPDFELRDSSGNGRHRNWSEHASTTLPGRIGQAIEFDGTNDYVCLDQGGHCVTDSESLFDSGFTERSFSVWFKPYIVSSGKRVIFEEGGGSNGFNIYVDNDSVFAGGWRSGWEDWLNAPIEANKWYHVVATYKANDTMYLYLNGELVDSSVTGSSIPAHSGDDALGMYDQDTKFHTGAVGGNGGFYSGALDDFRVYERVLSAEEVQQLYELGQ